MTNYNEKLDEIIRKLCHDFENRKVDSLQAQVDTKAAITSLIKELVVGVKPTRSETQIGNFIIYGDLSKRDLNIIDQFEQNLLKALEEV